MILGSKMVRRLKTSPKGRKKPSGHIEHPLPRKPHTHLFPQEDCCESTQLVKEWSI